MSTGEALIYWLLYVIIPIYKVGDANNFKELQRNNSFEYCWKTALVCDRKDNKNDWRKYRGFPARVLGKPGGSRCKFNNNNTNCRKNN